MASGQEFASKDMPCPIEIFRLQVEFPAGYQVNPQPVVYFGTEPRKEDLKMPPDIFSFDENKAINLEIDNKIISIAHLEWPCVLGRSIDLVLWSPDFALQAYKQWGTSRGILAKRIPLLAAIQIKRGGGRITILKNIEKDLRDLGAIHQAENLGKPILYFIEFADHGILKHKHDCDYYMTVQDRLNRWCSEQPGLRRAFLISRDRVGFAYPPDAWIVNPLPEGTREHVH